MVNEGIVGGLVAALARGESLEKAMMTFYNAGYTREEIEAAAKEVYSQTGVQVSKASLPGTSSEQAPKTPVSKKEKGKEPEKEQEKAPQNVSSYGQPSFSQPNREAEIVAKKIERAIKDLKQLNVPSKIEIISKNIESRPPTIVQKVSGYVEGPPKPVNKLITYLLVFLLIFLLGILAALFFFKNEIIEMFSSLGLA